MDSMSVNAALSSLGHQTSHSLQSLCIIPRNVIVYCIVVGDRRVPLAPSYKGKFSVPSSSYKRELSVHKNYFIFHTYRVSKKSRDGWIFPQVKYFSKK